MSKEQIEEMARCLENHTCMSQFQAEIASKMLYAKGYRKQSDKLVEVVRCYDCKYCEVVVDSIIDEPKYFCTRMVGSMPIDPTDYCSQEKMKGGE